MKTEREKVNRFVVIGTVLFAIAFFVVVFNGSTCERYNRRMERQQMMQQYLDTLKHQR